MADALLTEDFLRRLDRLSIVAKKLLSGRIKGERRSQKRGISSEFADFRNYVPGDDIRFIDWNIYGRLEQLFLKLFQEEEDLRVHILLDTSRSMSYGNPSKFDHARKIAASLGYIGLCSLDRIFIHNFASSLGAGSGSMRNKRSAGKLFNFCEQLKAEGATAFNECCQRFAVENGAGRGVAIIISDFLDPQGYADGLRYLLGRKLEIHVIQLLSPEELNPALQGDLRLVDCETRAATEVSISAPLLKAYHERLRLFREGLKEYCSARGISYLFSSTDQPFDQLVLTSLRQGGVLS